MAVGSNSVGGANLSDALDGGAGAGVLEQGADNFEAAGEITASTEGTQLTGGASNTKGSYTELVASTSFKTSGVIVCVQDFGATNQRHMIDIAIGAASSESVIIPDLYFSSSIVSTEAVAHPVFIPIEIASGSRIAARTQSEDASATCKISLVLIGETDGTASPATSLIAYGPDTSTTNLPGRDFGSAGSETANVKSGWTEITASTSSTHESFLVVLGGFNSAATDTTDFLIDIGIGSAGSEAVLIPNIMFSLSSDNDRVYHYIGPIPATIAENTRIAFRAQSDSVGTNFNIIEVAMYGV